MKFQHNKIPRNLHDGGSIDPGILSTDDLPDMEVIRNFPDTEAAHKRESKNRMAGFLDCLRMMLDQGMPDQKYVDHLALKTFSPSIRVEAVRKRLAE